MRVTMPIIGAAIGTAAAWIAMPWAGVLIDVAIPASRWFEVDSVTVQDTEHGRQPRVEVDRIVHRHFSGRWTVTLRRETGQGYADFCTRNGSNDYRKGSVLPAETDLEWWMDIPANPPCPDIPPGQYILTIAWTLEIAGLQPKVVRVESNVFEVAARRAAP